MRERRPNASAVAGASLAEFLVTAAILGIVMAGSVPLFSTYLHSSSLRAGAEEFATLVNLARSLAITENSRVCVALDPAGSHRVRLLIPSGNLCTAESGGPVRGRWYDSRADASGWITLQNDVAVTAATADVVFTSLGAAVPGGTYTLTRYGRSLTVVVAPSGRVSLSQ